MLKQTAHLALVLSLSAVVGFFLGRLLRGRRPSIETTRPRIAMSVAYLTDAHNDSLSPHTRFRCAYESLYFCYCELAGEHGIDLGATAHPSDDVVHSALSALEASEPDRRAAETLVNWARSTSPSVPAVTMTDACKLALRVCAATVSLLA